MLGSTDIFCCNYVEFNTVFVVIVKINMCDKHVSTCVHLFIRAPQHNPPAMLHAAHLSRLCFLVASQCADAPRLSAFATVLHAVCWCVVVVLLCACAPRNTLKCANPPPLHNTITPFSSTVRPSWPVHPQCTMLGGLALFVHAVL